jgi:hypothetical protein
MFEDLSDDGRLVSLDEGDDLHGSAAARAAERVGLVNALDEHGPILSFGASSLSAGSLSWSRRGRFGLPWRQMRR